MIPDLRKSNRIIPKLDSSWPAFSKKLGRCVEMGYFSVEGVFGLVRSDEGGTGVEEH
jgi:hypothetical protein